jgi:hypothetical protein
MDPQITNACFFFLNSNVPAANDVLVPESLLKKQTAEAKSAADVAAKKAELRKVRGKRGWRIKACGCISV